MKSIHRLVIRSLAWSFLGLVAASTHAAVPKIAAGFQHALFLKADGTVWAWGSNSYGSLGDGTTKSRGIPRRVPGLGGVKDVAAGGYYSLAVKANGTVWAWGSNGSGELGNGTTLDSSSPIAVSGLTGVTAVAAGSGHSLALKGDGTVWAWGYNGDGELGDGSTTNHSSPVQVLGLTGVVALAAGYDHSLALKNDGTVWAWGHNVNGQVGDGSTANRLSPVQLAGLSNVAAVSAGNGHSYALKSDGSVVVWGDNSVGQLCDGGTVGKLVPTTIPTLSGVSALAAGDGYLLAVKQDGGVWACGNNPFGQLGNGSHVDQHTPSHAGIIAGAVAVAAGSDVSLALRNDGTVFAWGGNNYGQLGLGVMTSIGRTSPAAVLALKGITTVSAGQYHTIAVRSDGTVSAWGQNSYGQLGDGTHTNRSSPVAASGLTQVAAVAAGGRHTLALKSDGTVWTWGSNANGQLGDGTTASHASPAAVTGLADVVAIAAGFDHSLAVKSDGSVWAWGHNQYGQLGDNTTTDRLAPVAVSTASGLANVVRVAAGTYFSLALDSTGYIHAWGNNALGSLGDGSTADRHAPVSVTSSGVLAIAAGSSHALAMDNSGQVFAWGYNAYGQLGDNSTTNRLQPVVVWPVGSGFVAAIAAGAYQSFAIMADGTPLVWGQNALGQLGDGTTTSCNFARIPPLPGGPKPFVAIAGGLNHGVGISADGVWSWGDSTLGQLGNGGTAQSLVPALIEDFFPTNGTLPSGWVATAGSYAPWTVAADAPYAGVQTLKSGTVANAAQSGVQTSANFRDGYMSFGRKVSSQAGGDWLRLYVDDVVKGEWSGEQDWARAGTFINAGNHTVAWKYEKNASGSAGSDAAWIDSVELPTTFADVSSSSAFFDYINALKDAGITTGCGGNNYCPNQNVTRDQMAAFIVRAKEGEPTSACSTAPFSDVPISNSFCKYITRMSALGITTGCGSGNYCPSQNVDRQQMAAFIVRAVEGNPPAGYCGTTAPFNDVPVSNTFCGHIRRMKELNITTGCGNGNYCPSQSVTRDQMAAFLARAFLGM